jgi:beta-lactam-binding protein with PASTA domain
VGKITSYGITGVQSGTTIYIAMAAYDTSQNDSALSAEQHVTVPNVTITVLNVVGNTQAAASSALTSAGLTVGTITQSYSSTVASGNVISQSPVSGTSVASGSAVSLKVSKGTRSWW